VWLLSVGSTRVSPPASGAECLLDNDARTLFIVSGCSGFLFVRTGIARIFLK
jgi:hypothetical protein